MLRGFSQRIGAREDARAGEVHEWTDRVHRLVPTTPAELIALRRLLVLRALLAEHEDLRTHAIRDLEDALALRPAVAVRGDESLADIHLN